MRCNSSKSYVQKHKYNGKEFDNMHVLNSYDYGARQYNLVTARWDRVPLNEKYYSVSPYNYCMNNPVMVVEQDGRDWVVTNQDVQQSWIWNADITSADAAKEAGFDE